MKNNNLLKVNRLKIIDVRFLFAVAVFTIASSNCLYAQTTIRPTSPGTVEEQRQKVILDRLNRNEVEEINLSNFKLSKDDKKLIAPNEVDSAGYAEFLRLPNTEIIKLLNSFCTQINNTAEFSAGCKSGIPGFGRYYSFTNRQHIFPKLANIQLINDELTVAGFLTQGIMVSLGVGEIEKITLQSDGVNFLAAFTPAETVAEAEAQAELIKKGINKGRYIYSRSVKIEESNVYAMRFVAYRSKVKTVSFDNRKDVIIAFKIIRQDSNKNVTLIWRELQNKDAPKLKEN